MKDPKRRFRSLRIGLDIDGYLSASSGSYGEDQIDDDGKEAVSF